MKDKKKMIGWVLSLLIFLFMVFVSAQGKFFEFEGKEEMFSKMGFTTETMFYIGIVEVLVAVLFLVPGRVGFLGSLLVTTYLGGAVVTHVRVNEPFFFPIIIGFLVWIAFTLRDKNFKKFLTSK